MALHTFNTFNNEVVDGTNQETSTIVDENNCTLLVQEASRTSDLNPEVVNEKNDVVQVADQDQQVQEMPKRRISEVFPSLDFDDEGNLVNRDSGPIALNHPSIQGAVKASSTLLNTILDFVGNDEKDEEVRDHEVRDYLTKFFDELNGKPFKEYVGTNGTGWYAVYLMLLRYKNEPDMVHVFRGLNLIVDLQDKSGLLMASFNPDKLAQADPTLDLLARELFNLGYVFQEKFSGVNPVSNLNETLVALSDVTKEALKEASAAISTSGGGYSNSFDGWDLLKWTAIGAAVIGGGYLAYKGYQALTEDDPNDVVFIDVDDYDTGHLDFI